MPILTASAAIVVNNLPGTASGWVGNNVFWYAAGITVPGGSNYVLNSFSAEVVANGGASVNFTAYLYGDNGGGLPGALIANLGTQAANAAPATYTFPAGQTLTAGTRYWLAIGGTAGGPPFYDWRASAAPGGWFYGYASSNNSGATWGAAATAVAFSVDADPVGGPVPGPTTSDSPDDRINWKHGDQYAALYARQDDNTKPVLHVYCITPEGKGDLKYVAPNSMFANAPQNPASNTKIGETNVCRYPVVFYVLTSGEFQINIGPDWEGKTNVIIFTGMPPGNIHFYDFDVFHPITW
jgi:hypothetical protein